MVYKPFDSDLIKAYLGDLSFRSELEYTGGESVPYGVFHAGNVLACLIRDGYLDSGLFVSIVGPDGESSLYGFSQDAWSASDVEVTAWAIGLHLKILGLPLTAAGNFEYRLYRLTTFLDYTYGRRLQKGDTLYAYLNGVPYARVIRGETQTYFYCPDSEKYHTLFHSVTPLMAAQWKQCLAEILKHQSTALAVDGTVDNYTGTVKAIDMLVDKLETPG